MRETKKYYFGNKSSTGFVILAQTGLSSLSPEISAKVVQRLLNQEFKSIDGAIICTPHFRTKNPFTLKINPECVSITNNSIPKLRKQCIELADDWVKYFANGGFTCTQIEY